MDVPAEKFKSWREINSFLLQKQNADPAAALNELLTRFDTEALELRKYQLRVSGDKYNASINAAFAQSIIDFQKCFNEIINSLYKNVKKSKRENIDVYFTFERGSSYISSEDVYDLLSQVCNSVFSKMDSKQVTLIVIILILCFFAGKAWETYSHFRNQEAWRKAELQNKENERKAALEAKEAELRDKNAERIFILQLIALISDKKIQNAFDTAGREGRQLRQKIIDAAPADGVESIEINGETLNKEEINNLKTRQFENTCAEFIVKEKFKVLDISIPENKKVRLGVKRLNAPRAPLFTLYGRAEEKGTLTQEEINFICRSVIEHNQIIEIQAKLYVEGSVAVKGEIISFVELSSAENKSSR